MKVIPVRFAFRWRRTVVTNLLVVGRLHCAAGQVVCLWHPLRQSACLRREIEGNPVAPGTGWSVRVFAEYRHRPGASGQWAPCQRGRLIGTIGGELLWYHSTICEAGCHHIQCRWFLRNRICVNRHQRCESRDKTCAQNYGANWETELSCYIGHSEYASTNWRNR